MGYQYEVGSEEEGEIENQFDSILTKVYLLMNTGNILFLVSFGFLIFGIYGKYQNRHGFFFPMIVMEWLQCWIPLVVLAMGCVASIGMGEDQVGPYRHNGQTAVGIIITMLFWIPMQAVYIMFPIYLNRYRVHVKEVSKYSSFA